jgi:hypothetical protein
MPIDSFIELLGKNQRYGSLYHFTDRGNLQSINDHGGLLPMRLMRELGIAVAATGGNEMSLELDKAFGMDAYVHLCFTTNHPMEHLAKADRRIKDRVWLRIKPEVLKLPGVQITAEVSNKRGVVPMDVTTGLSELDREVIYTRTEWKDPAIYARRTAAEKWEVLVPDIVPLDYIRNPNG